jgi:choline dehydrogenase
LGGFVRSSEDFSHPNIQFHFFPSLVIDHGLQNPDKHAYQFHASPNRPTSRGWVKLRTSNPNDLPVIQFNYLETEGDRQQMRDCVRISRKVLSQKSLQTYSGKEIRPGINVQNDEELDEIIRNTSETAYHPSCSNKMGIDNMSVVDADTKVYGINNLRIVDSSILPDIVSGNLNASTVMIAEKASDIILGKLEAEPVELDYYKAA